MLTVVNRKAFDTACVKFPNCEIYRLESCVWDARKGFLSKPVLYPVYGDKLSELFQSILKVPNATSAEAREHLEQLRDDDSTTMADATEVYVFLQKYHADK
jgi:hypothetical protein